jgi:hypothetical protein
MDPIWTELAKQVPALVVFALVMMWVVTKFLKHIREISSDFKSTIEEINVTVNDQITLFRERCERAIDNNTTALARNSALHEQVLNATGNGRFCENFKAIQGRKL